jgi:hypothetical protein
MCGGPAIGEHLFEAAIVSVSPQQEFSNVGPRFNTMSFGTGQDRGQHGRP